MSRVAWLAALRHSSESAMNVVSSKGVQQPIERPGVPQIEYERIVDVDRVEDVSQRVRLVLGQAERDSHRALVAPNPVVHFGLGETRGFFVGVHGRNARASDVPVPGLFVRRLDT
jgi:hypothetical protein